MEQIKGKEHGHNRNRSIDVHPLHLSSKGKPAARMDDTLALAEVLPPTILTLGPLVLWTVCTVKNCYVECMALRRPLNASPDLALLLRIRNDNPELQPIIWWNPYADNSRIPSRGGGGATAKGLDHEFLCPNRISAWGSDHQDALLPYLQI